jgi:hypothetical protein
MGYHFRRRIVSFFHKKEYRLSDFPKHKQRLTSWVKEHGYFSVSVGPPRVMFGISKRKRLKIYKNVLDKFIPLAAGFYIYDLNYDSDLVRPHHKDLLQDHSRYKIIFDNNGWRRFDSLLYSTTIMRSISEIRGGIVGKCKMDDATLKSVFEHCCNPTVIGNAGVTCGKNALSWAKNSGEKGVFYVIIGTLSRGLESITLVSGRNEISRLLDIASQSCIISRSHKNFHIDIYDIDGKESAPP